jgi:hypothetical protein
MRDFENKVLIKIFGLKMEEDGSWRELQNELHDLYYSPNNFSLIKSKRMRCAGLVVRMGREEVFTGIWFGGPMVR